MDPPQTWHGPPPGPWECPTHTFLGGTLTRGGKMCETFPYCSGKNNLIIQIQIISKEEKVQFWEEKKFGIGKNL